MFPKNAEWRLGNGKAAIDSFRRCLAASAPEESQPAIYLNLVQLAGETGDAASAEKYATLVAARWPASAEAKLLASQRQTRPEGAARNP